MGVVIGKCAGNRVVPSRVKMNSLVPIDNESECSGNATHTGLVFSQKEMDDGKTGPSQCLIEEDTEVRGEKAKKHWKKVQSALSKQREQCLSEFSQITSFEIRHVVDILKAQKDDGLVIAMVSAVKNVEEDIKNKFNPTETSEAAKDLWGTARQKMENKELTFDNIKQDFEEAKDMGLMLSSSRDRRRGRRSGLCARNDVEKLLVQKTLSYIQEIRREKEDSEAIS